MILLFQVSGSNPLYAGAQTSARIVMQELQEAKGAGQNTTIEKYGFGKEIDNEDITTLTIDKQVIKNLQKSLTTEEVRNNPEVTAKIQLLLAALGEKSNQSVYLNTTTGQYSAKQTDESRQVEINGLTNKTVEEKYVDRKADGNLDATGIFRLANETGLISIEEVQANHRNVLKLFEKPYDTSIDPTKSDSLAKREEYPHLSTTQANDMNQFQAQIQNSDSENSFQKHFKESDRSTGGHTSPDNQIIDLPASGTFIADIKHRGNCTNVIAMPSLMIQGNTLQYGNQQLTTAGELYNTINNIGSIGQATPGMRAFMEELKNQSDKPLSSIVIPSIMYDEEGEKLEGSPSTILANHSYFNKSKFRANLAELEKTLVQNPNITIPNRETTPSQ